MYSEYLGDGYHDTIRSMLKTDEFLLPDSMIDAEASIEAMRMIVTPLYAFVAKGDPTPITTEEQFKVIQEAGRYALCAILCHIIGTSRIQAEGFERYRNIRWEKKREKFLNLAYKTMEKYPKGGVLNAP